MGFVPIVEYERSKKLHAARREQLKEQLAQQGEEAEQPAANRPASAGAGWCFAPVDSVGINDLSHRSFEVFRDLACIFNTGAWLVKYLGDIEILVCLMLVIPRKPRRAAVLLFHSDPGSIFPGFGVTLIQYKKYAALLENTTLTGSLVSIVWYLMAVECRRYRYRDREYKYGGKIGTWARRAFLNALVNNNYAAGRSIEVCFGDDEISVRSSCILPDGWTPERLLKSYLDEPFNPEIAHAFCAGGFFYPEYDLLEEQKFGVPKCTVQGDVLTVSLEIFRDFMPKDYRGYDDEYDEDAEDDDDDDYDEEDD